MGAGDFHGRVRDGIGCGLPAKATRLSNPPWSLLNRVCGSGVVCADLGLWMISMHGCDGFRCRVEFEPIG
jgi:hypothetical protein